MTPYDSTNPDTETTSLRDDNKPSRAEAEQAVDVLLRWAGDDPSREGLVDTPARVCGPMKFSLVMQMILKRCWPGPLKRLKAMMIW